MITSLRAAIACGEIIHRDDGGVDFLDVRAERILAGTRPGAATVSLAILLDLDGAATSGRLELRAPEFSHDFPFRTPANLGSTALLIPFDLPIPREGQLIVRIIDTGRGGRVFKSQFDLRFVEGAEELGPAAAREIIDDCNARAEAMKTDLAGALLQ